MCGYSLTHVAVSRRAKADELLVGREVPPKARVHVSFGVLLVFAVYAVALVAVAAVAVAVAVVLCVRACTCTRVNAAGFPLGFHCTV